VARGLGVAAGVRVTSPTFELVHEFEARLPLIHVDLYRLDQADSLIELGLLERVGADAAMLVEWGERFADVLGDEGLLLRLSRTSATGRSCHVEARGRRGQALAARLKRALDAAPVQW
jgi:tRNA threonylcarbamoyladenosine biosynthesis protein TsaE